MFSSYWGKLSWDKPKLLMSNPEDQHFKIGQTVFTKVAPTVKVLVRKYYANIYYCTFADDPNKKELALFEREIIH